MKREKLFLRFGAILPILLLTVLYCVPLAQAKDGGNDKLRTPLRLHLKIVRNLTTCGALGCHDSEDQATATHGNQFNDQVCSECHTLTSWKPSTFVHKNQTYGDFKLTGKHTGLTCGYCHRPKLGETEVIYKPIIAERCFSSGCHDSQMRGNAHGIQFKRRACGKCHTQESWLPHTFSHGSPKYRKFKLKGKHRHVPCAGCHKKNMLGFTKYRPLRIQSCGVGACHEKRHKGVRNRMECELCHDTKGWNEVTFDHNSLSAFKIDGAHLKLRCDACHIGKKWRPMLSDCVDCHEEADVHNGKLGVQCDQCHVTKTWKPLTFDHELTGFKLVGTHAQFACIDCHKEKGVYGGLGSECTQCHIDPHFNQFGAACEECHTPEQWGPRLFRHNSTAFRLDGVHRILSCDQCHANRRYRGTPIDCIFCHTNEFQAPEAEQFHKHGLASCEICHKTWAWTPARLFRHSIMTFSGSHKLLEQDCEYCHYPGPTPKFPGAGSEQDCFACHMADYSSVHANGDPVAYPPCPDNCGICHSTVDFGDIKGSRLCD